MVLNYESDFYFPRAQGLTVFIDTYLFDQGQAEIPHTTPLDLLVVR
ncbi:MAG TPA: hypothetical protein VJN41_07595 [Alphaproteobacteria bacterium]|nr:hypothetical protein [Alphaproteobacteria bacterium]